MDQTEFEQLYEQTAKPIFAYLLAVTGQRHVADDLQQETFVRFLSRKNMTGSVSLEDMRRYLFKIASNLVRDRWRKGENRPGAEIEEAFHVPGYETTLYVQEMIQRLSSRDRELLWLAYVEGMNHNEIAAATGISQLSVRMLLFRARKRAKEILEREFGVDENK